MPFLLKKNELWRLRVGDLVAGAPKTIEITSAQVHDALIDPLTEVVDAVKTALEKNTT